MMNKPVYIYYFFLIWAFASCSSQQIPRSETEMAVPYYIKHITPLKADINFDGFKLVNWIDLQTYIPGLVYDIKYAGKDNFTGQKIYPCAKCFVRPEVAVALSKVQKDLKKQGLGLIVYDCYRPYIFQKKLWEISPDSRYVANPSKGSMHNRGLAIDLALVDLEGKIIDMGTEYDSFGPKSHSGYTQLPPKPLYYRKILRQTMQKYGMEPIRTEWWHFSYRKKKYPLARWVWDCD